MSRILKTWKSLDVNDDGERTCCFCSYPILPCLSAGSVSIDELIRALVPMGAEPLEIEKMVKVADTDGDGEARHSNSARAN